MSQVLSGIRVVEVSEFGMVPGCGAVLADWGAGVIKVERTKGGDPVRHVTAMGLGPGMGGFDGIWEIFNRNKRSIGLDLQTEDGLAALLEIVKGADVFITNFLPRTREKLRIDVAHLRAVNPRLIYGRGSAHGPKGPEAGLGGFDGLTYWMRSGAGHAATPAKSTEFVTLPGPAFGDIQTGQALAGGIAAALFHRERTGEAKVVDISLLSNGMWAMQGTLFGWNVTGAELPHSDHSNMPNPISNNYLTKDGRRIALSMHQGDRYWPRLCEIWGRPDMATDPRFKDIPSRMANNQACIKELDGIFIQRTLAEWTAALSQQDGQWTIVRIVKEAMDDPQLWANAYLQEVDYGDGRKTTLVPAPVQFDEAPNRLRAAPALGAQSDDILRDAGITPQRIDELRKSGAVV